MLLFQAVPRGGAAGDASGILEQAALCYHEGGIGVVAALAVVQARVRPLVTSIPFKLRFWGCPHSRKVYSTPLRLETNIASYCCCGVRLFPNTFRLWSFGLLNHFRFGDWFWS